jgi:O-acetyl-ADP-ribose deacetylase (regulator of RNase III)
MEQRYPVGKSEVWLSLGDITRERTDAIANAANSGLGGGGGVDGAIHRAAGPQLLAACREARKALPAGGLPAGQAIITPGFDLPARHVIHCVGPIYYESFAAAPVLLASCYESALRLCRELGLASVAFPAISTGIYGYPLEEAALVSLCAIRNDLLDHGSPALVKMVLFDTRAYRAFADAAEANLKGPFSAG